MPTNPRTVAVVEDNTSCRLALQRILYAHGYRVEAFESAEAYLAVADVSLAFCLVVDVQLGAGLTGFELAEEIAASGLSRPVIFMSAADDDDAQRRARELGCVEFLAKPFSVDALFAAIHRASTLRP